MRMNHARFLALAIASSFAAHAEEKPPGKLFDKGNGIPIGTSIEKLLVDNAAGSVSAASLAGVQTDSMAVVENIRDASLLIKGFDDSAKAFGIAITPARTNAPFPSFSLREYAAPDGHMTRLLASLTFSYAQGSSEIEKSKFTRRAVSLTASAFWKVEQDPVYVVATSVECGKAALDVLGPDKPSMSQAEIDKAAAEATKAESSQPAEASKAKQPGKAPKAERVTEEQEKAAKKAWDGCIAPLLKKLEQKWNRTRYSISYATGSIKRTDGTGDSESLGHTVAATLVYGFDGIEALKDRAAMTVLARHSRKEPVLTSLVTGPMKFKDSTLVAIRLSGGSSTFRALVEANNAKSTELTTSQHTLRRALGIDYRLMDGLWLNLRYGKQRKLDNSGKDETGSFLALNYSPSALLGR